MGSSATVTNTPGTVSIEYVPDGSTILAEQNGNITLRYIYDADGSPVAMYYQVFL